MPNVLRSLAPWHTAIAVAALASGAMPRQLRAQLPADTTARPFETWTRTLPYRRGVVVWVRNTSADTLLLQRVHVTRCLNVGAGCGTAQLDLLLPPNDSLPALTIRPRLWDDRYVYQLSWEWLVRGSAGDR
jgi:hypothetical protein